MRSRRLVIALAATTLVCSLPAAASAAVKAGTPGGVVPHRKAVQLPSFQQSPELLLSYHGGPVLRTNETFAIFWDPDGRFSPSYRELVVRYLRDIAADSGRRTNVYSVLEQYGDETGPIAYDSTFAGSAVNRNPYPSGCPASPEFPDCFTDQQLAVELDRFLFEHGIARPANRAFFVLTPAGVNSCFIPVGLICRSTDFCGYHSSLTSEHGDVIYANVPYAAAPGCDSGQHPNGSDADPAINILSQEHRGMINNPLGSAWRDDSGREGSDKCSFLFGPTGSTGAGAFNQVINGHPYLLQMEWSNVLARATASSTGGPPMGFGCVLDGADRAPVPAFTATVNGSTVSFDASATTDPDSGDAIRAYVWRFGDGLGGFDDPSPRHRYAAGGTYRVSLQVMDSHGATAVTERVIAVAQPAPAPTRSFKARLDENLDVRGFGSGSGTATRLGAVSERAQLFWNFDDWPAAYHAVGDVSLTNNSGDLLSARYEATLTDTASPPQGNSFTLRGTYEIQGGRQALHGATGSGTITGTCTSSPERFDADCHTEWQGTIGS